MKPSNNERFQVSELALAIVPFALLTEPAADAGNGGSGHDQRQEDPGMVGRKVTA